MTEILDGFIVDVDSGEVVGLAGHDPAFHITDRTSAEWVLEKMSQNATALKALELRRETLLQNLERQQQEIERRAAWLNHRFGAELREWATSQLAGQKRRSLQLDWGKIGFRKTHGAVKVFDVPNAVFWLEKHCPKAVQMEPKVLVSQIPENLRDALPTNCFDYTPPEDKFYIS